MNYAIKMELHSYPAFTAGSDAEKEFKLRFTSFVKNAWNQFAKTATSKGQLKGILDDKIGNDLLDAIMYDFGLDDPADVDIAAFSNAGWEDLGGGQHQSQPLRVRVTNGTHGDWSYFTDTQNATIYYMEVVAEFVET